MDTPNRFNQGAGLIAAAIVGAALIVSWSLPDEPRYQLASSGSTVFRMDTDSGALIACDNQRCTSVQAPDRAKTLGALEVQFGSKEKPNLAAPAENAQE